MAALTGTSSSYSVGSGGGLREDLSDVIWDLFPADTWALTNLSRQTAQATYTEWLGQEAAAAGANIGIEGDDATFATLVSPARYGTYLQISSKTFLVSGTLEKVNKAGRRSEVARSGLVNMKELKRDMEFTLTNNAFATAGSATVGRSTAGIEAWLGATTASSTVATTVVLATSTASASTATRASGTAGTAVVDGTTTGALTEATLKLALQSAWTNGGDPSTVLVGATQKTKIDAFTGVATRFVDVARTQQASITGAANVYVSDYGVHKVVLHRYMRSSIVLCLDPSYWAVSYLRAPFKQELAKTGDGTKHQMLTEYALIAKNWRASAKVVACA